MDAQFEDQQTTVGLVVDAVSQVMELAQDDIQPARISARASRWNYLIGRAQSGKKSALLLDVDQVVTTEELMRSEPGCQLGGKHRAGRT